MIISMVILASSADAVPITYSSFCKAFTVQLQAVYLGAFASRMVIIHLHPHQLRHSGLRRVASAFSLFEQFLKQIFPPPSCYNLLINHPQAWVITGHCGMFFPWVSSEHRYVFKFIESSVTTSIIRGKSV
jgi:hypothetical protein